MSGEVLLLTGSPSATSRSSAVARALAARLEAAGHRTRWYSVRDLDPADVLLARVESAAVRELVDAAGRAPAIVLSTPVYKATYAGGLKAVVDLIPPDALAGKPALGIGTTRLGAHAATLGRAYEALFAFFRARPVETLVLLDDEVTVDGAGAATLAPGALDRLGAAASALDRALSDGAR